MSNRRKAAIILSVVGPERAAKVIRHLGEDQVEMLTLEMARIERVSPDVRAQVIQEFHELA
ncbi:flagellar motor switch protein FliG, partial [Acinetobacter baumannii]